MWHDKSFLTLWFKFPLHPQQNYYITEFGFSELTQMKDDYTTNSHYLTLYIVSLKGRENVHFELRINLYQIAPYYQYWTHEFLF